MRKSFFLLTLVFALAGANFAFCQTKLSSEQKKNNEHEMLMRMIRNKDRDKSLEIESVSLEGDSISKFKRQIYRGHSNLKKAKSNTDTDDKFDAMSPKLIGPIDESIDLTPEELRDQQVRDSLSEVYSRQPLPWDKFSDSVMSEKKDPLFVEKQKVNQVVPENNKHYFLKAFFIALVACAVLLVVNQWSYILDSDLLTKKIPPTKK